MVVYHGTIRKRSPQRNPRMGFDCPRMGFDCPRMGFDCKFQPVNLGPTISWFPPLRPSLPYAPPPPPETRNVTHMESHGKAAEKKTAWATGSTMEFVKL